MISKQESRAIIRQAVKRVPEGEEIRHLNIMPMMDIVTILLVAFLVSAAESSAAVELNSVDLPTAQSFEPPPELTEVVTISTEAILVGGEPLMAVLNGDVDQSAKKYGALGLTIPKLSQFLGFVRKDTEEGLRANGIQPPKIPELVIIADKSIPFKLLYQVIASSRTEVAGYRKFRLLVLERE